MTIKRSRKGQIPARRKSRRQPRPATLSKSSPQLLSLPESDLDTFFESGPFSALCQGATGAEIADDFKLLGMAIEEMTKAFLDSHPAATSKSPIFVRDIPENWETSVTSSTILTPPGTGSHKSQELNPSLNRPLTHRPLNEEAFQNYSAIIPVHDMKKYTCVVAPMANWRWGNRHNCGR